MVKELFKDIKIYDKNGGVPFLHTIGWKFSYKGSQYGNYISDQRPTGKYMTVSAGLDDDGDYYEEYEREIYETVPITPKEEIALMKNMIEVMEKLSKKQREIIKQKATVEDIKNLVKELEKHKVKKPYYLKMENPKECFDLLGVTYKEREKIQKKIVKDMQKATDKREPIKGTIINCDTIRKGVKFLENEMYRHMEEDLEVKKTI